MNTNKSGFPNISEVGIFGRLKLNIIHLFRNRLNWWHLQSNNALPIEFIREHIDYIDWSCGSLYRNMTHADIVEFEKYLNIPKLLNMCILDIESLRLLKDKLDFDNVAYTQILNDEIIREFADKWDWGIVAFENTLSPEIIREFADKWDWSMLSREQMLSEDIIREYSDKVEWDLISAYQQLSEEFILEFIDRVNITTILRRQRVGGLELSYEFLNTFDI
ncbi:MAG: hypothetical protein ACRDD8_10485 [Bacteroidales bacterium]